jgi:hypothetical protein
MSSEADASTQPRTDLPDIRAQLERILASEVFSRSSPCSSGVHLRRLGVHRAAARSELGWRRKKSVPGAMSADAVTGRSI